MVTQAVIPGPVADVAAYTGDPTNIPQWRTNVVSVSWQTMPPVTTGSHIVLGTRFRRCPAVCEVVTFVPGQRLVLRTAQGLCPRATTYTWQPVLGGTMMTVRNQATLTGWRATAASVIAAVLKRAEGKHLAALAEVLRHTIPAA